MKKIVVFLFITCICLSSYANNTTMINEDEYLLYENNVYETKIDPHKTE